MFRTLIAAVLSFIAVAVQAQPVQGDDLIVNGDFVQYIETKDGAGNVLYRQPASWNCTNYPRQNKACVYDYVSGTASILSATVGIGLPARYVWPSNPQWWQTVQVPIAGTYNLTVKVKKVAQATVIAENPGQSVVIKDGLTPLVQAHHSTLPVGVETVLSVPVTFTAPGTHYLYLGLTHRTTSGYGYKYDFNEVKLTYAGY